MSDIERELKLTPADAGLLERLACMERLGEFQVTGRRRELQHNSFFDIPSRALGAVGVGFRRRTIDGQRLASWTLKGPSSPARLRGIATRNEIELQLGADMPPVMALAALRSAARERKATVLSEILEDALAGGGLPLPAPLVESDTDRLALDLVDSTHGWKVELALDSVQLVEHNYRELEIEAELKQGGVAALDVVREAIAAMGEVRESQGSKLSRALAHVQKCTCRTARTESGREPG